MPLTMARPRNVNYIKKVIGKDTVRQHLANLGFVAGERVVIISRIGGNMILQIKESRVALSEMMAGRIIV